MLAFMSGLARTGVTSTVLSFQVLIFYPTVLMDPRMDEDLGTTAFSYLFLDFVIPSTEHHLLTNLLKMKPPAF